MNSNQKFVAYYRVSTKKQNDEMPAQKTAVKNYLKNHYPPVKSFRETESGGKSDRPELKKALEYCIQNNCKLVVAKLDRLSRDLEFIARLQKSRVDFICCDMPEANSLTISLLGCLAQWEREQISKRTKEALAEIKSDPKRKTKLGSHNKKVLKGLKKYWLKCKQNRIKKQTNKKQSKKSLHKPTKLSAVQISDNSILQTIRALKSQGFSLKKIAESLNKTGVPTRRSGKWSDRQIFRIVKRNNVA